MVGWWWGGGFKSGKYGRWLNCATHFPFFGQKLLDDRCSVWTRIIMEKEEPPISSHFWPHISPHFWPYMGNMLTQTVQNLNVKRGIHCLTFRYIFMVNYTFAVKKQNQQRIYPWFLKSKFFGGRRVRTTPFRTLAFCFQIICKTPAFVTNNYRVQKVCVAFHRFN